MKTFGEIKKEHTGHLQVLIKTELRVKIPGISDINHQLGDTLTILKLGDTFTIL